MPRWVLPRHGGPWKLTKAWLQSRFCRPLTRHYGLRKERPMISHLKDFEILWMQEFDKTQKVFKHIPDKALAQAVDPAGRSLGRLAWHITITIPEMMGQTGLNIAGPHHEEPVPQSMSEIRRAYEQAGPSAPAAGKPPSGTRPSG